MANERSAAVTLCYEAESYMKDALRFSEYMILTFPDGATMVMKFYQRAAGICVVGSPDESLVRGHWYAPDASLLETMNSAYDHGSTALCVVGGDMGHMREMYDELPSRDHLLDLLEETITAAPPTFGLHVTVYDKTYLRSYRREQVQVV